MKRHVILISVISVTCVWDVGCDSKPSGPPSSPATDASGVAAASSAEKDFRTWKLADGTEFNCWVSRENRSGEHSWIWCDVETGPASFRITGGGQPGDWKRMAKIEIKEGSNEAVADPNGKFGANVVLSRGKYSVSFKIGAQEFSAVELRVD
jgi:hypothetical protein